ncbi:MAG TPA: sulfite exporter TauE/SafE family protein [Methylomirabilota bacterium]|nr:sulfite exporter TauE/SafE family protein [Methylomirabilota bacterium]
MTAAFGALAVMLAAFVKGAVSFGFPTIATPLLALVVDVKTAVAILVLPNLVMDGIQALRRPGLAATVRRHATLYLLGIVGTFIGTHLLKRFSDRQALLALGAFVLIFVALNVSRLSLRVNPAWERVLAPPMGLVAGVVGGVTNVPGTPLVIYFYALGMDKAEFVRSIAVSFIVYKAAQLVAVIQAGMMTSALFGLSVAATLAAVGAFWLGLLIQDRMNQRTFNRVVLGVLTGLGVFLVYRAIG